MTPITSAAAEVKDPERYKQELLAIEKRLDAKLKELDEKLERLEKLKSMGESAGAVAASAGPDSGAEVVLDEPDAVIAEEVRHVAESNVVPEPDDKKAKTDLPDGFANVSYGKNGFEFRTENNR
ncbi:MAG TPA: hypothetical protein PKY85_09975, partial [Nitrosomonas sp.]|nr:hypothetical protein [Nitrosomonas sp.]